MWLPELFGIGSERIKMLQSLELEAWPSVKREGARSEKELMRTKMKASVEIGGFFLSTSLLSVQPDVQY